MKDSSFIRLLRKRLAGKLPGVVAQEKLAPVPRAVSPYGRPEDAAVPSSVLILLFPAGETVSFILTERTSWVEHHQRQVSLPGGGQEEGESLQETALRETREELGIDVERISVLGKLTSLFIPVSGFRVHPFVGWLPQKPEMSPDPTEVKSVHVISVDQLLDKAAVKRETRALRGQEVDVPYFYFDGLKVWGATASILSEFREIVRRQV